MRALSLYIKKGKDKDTGAKTSMTGEIFDPVSRHPAKAHDKL
jgi:hypothetical protein